MVIAPTENLFMRVLKKAKFGCLACMPKPSDFLPSVLVDQRRVYNEIFFSSVCAFKSTILFETPGGLFYYIKFFSNFMVYKVISLLTDNLGLVDLPVNKLFYSR